MFDTLFQSWRNSLSPVQTLKTAKLQLLAAGEADEDAVALGFCEQAEISLDRLKKPKSSSAQELLDHPTFCGEVAAAYNEHAKFMAYWKYNSKEQSSLDKCQKWGLEAETAYLYIARNASVRQQTNPLTTDL
ncbi:hypothetical protein KVV02_002920 [Mortierella alpina]|uniref:Uncharacterized protein n=1 Tax=Mortierella alpina TaxID=64518 RepID=A0A9P8D122_MORAP|nr:hypothetical protein KVV02_002920 [Mortierella alpina]